MPIVIVKTVEGMTQEEKVRLIERVTDAMKEIGKNPETTHVIIEEYDAENWGLGGRSVSKIRAAK